MTTRCMFWCLSGVLLAAACSVSQAIDLSVGGSISRGMAGAGLAIAARPESQMHMNPAAVAYVSKVTPTVGNINVSLKNISLRQLQDVYVSGNKGAFDINDIARVIRTFAEKDEVNALVSLDGGLAAPGLAITGGVTGDIRLYMNRVVQDWASDRSASLSGAKTDAVGIVVMSAPDFTGAVRTASGHGELAIGGRVRVLRAFYTHYYADEAELAGSNAGKRAAEMNNSDYLSKNGVSVDFGLLYKPDPLSPWRYAVAVENLFEPNIKFAATPRFADDRTLGPTTEIRPMKRNVSAGAAYERGKTTFALDWVDISNATGQSELRAGIDQRLGKGWAVRCGYGTRNGLAAGVDILGISISIADQFPLQLSRSITF